MGIDCTTDGLDELSFSPGALSTAWGEIRGEWGPSY